MKNIVQKNTKVKTASVMVLLVSVFLLSALGGAGRGSAAADGWTLIHDGRGVKAYPDLREYVWQKNTSAAPHGIYDKIGLHRLVKTGITLKGVIFMNHWAGNSVEQLMSNPPEDNWTKYENCSQAIYWANRGFDVYTIDYRTGFVPLLNSSQLSFMADWSLDVWLSDLREAVLKTKEISGAKKIFMTDVGLSYGAMNYAAKYWKDDLKGIILLGIEFPALGGSPIGGKAGIQTNTYNATKAINDMNSKGNWSDTNIGLELFQYAAANPGAPPTNPWTGQPLMPAINPRTSQPFANISENMAFKLAGTGAITNIYGGYADTVTTLQYYGSQDYYTSPWRYRIERQAMIDWVNCPYLTYDYDDHWNEIGVPMIVFASELYDNRTGILNLTNGINNTDFTGILLPKYGWLDVYVGTYSARDVSEPAYKWMVSRAGVRAIMLTPMAQAPGASVTVDGMDFGAINAVGIGFGAEASVSEANLPFSGPGPGPYYTYSGTVAHHPIKPGSFNLTTDTSASGGGITKYWDLGNGSITTSVTGFMEGTINYLTGQFSHTLWKTLEGTQKYSANYVRYEYDVTPVAGVTTNSSGVFAASITVPAVANGAYAVAAVDSQGHTATEILTVDNTIPEGLTIGVMLLLSTVAVIVSIRYYRKRPKWENW